MSALALMCDPRDINRTLGDGSGDAGPGAGHPAGRNPHTGHTGGFDPTVFLFDALPGGVGLAERMYERAPELLDRARSLIEGCPCKAGCPACVGPEEDAGARKRVALAILTALELRAATPAPALVAEGQRAP